jgi:hypothetical protein
MTQFSMNEREAFLAMSRFLWQFANRAGDDLLTLLGDITIRSDGDTTDPAAWDDWMDCVRTVKEGVSSQFGDETTESSGKAALVHLEEGDDRST